MFLLLFYVLFIYLFVVISNIIIVFLYWCLFVIVCDLFVVLFLLCVVCYYRQYTRTGFSAATTHLQQTPHTFLMSLNRHSSVCLLLENCSSTTRFVSLSLNGYGTLFQPRLVKRHVNYQYTNMFLLIKQYTKQK